MALVLQVPLENGSIKNHNPIDISAITSYCLSFIQIDLFLKFVLFFCVVKLLFYCFIFTEPSVFVFPLGLMGDQKKVCSVEDRLRKKYFVRTACVNCYFVTFAFTQQKCMYTCFHLIAQTAFFADKSYSRVNSSSKDLEIRLKQEYLMCYISFFIGKI